MQQLVKVVLIGSLILAVVSFIQRDRFPANMSLNPAVLMEPKQEPVSKSPFSVAYNENNYQVQALYNYEIYGLVVSYQHHDGDRMLHKLWNDHLNLSDLCIVWGDNARHPDLNALDFWNGQFTCNVQTKDSNAWSRFSMHKLSNNHLITENQDLRDAIGGVKIGDQVRIRGWLSSYKGEAGGGRGTSTVRTDTGNGACETIYVNEFDILLASNNGWRTALNISLTLLGLSLIVYFALPHRV